MEVTGNSAYDKGRIAGKHTAKFVLVVLGIIGLRLLFSLGGSTPAAPSVRQPVAPASRRSSANDLPSPGDPSLRGGQNTFASNPARLQISAVQWLAANPWVPIMGSCFAVPGLLLLFVKPPAGFVLLLTGAAIAGHQLYMAKHKFFGGDVCPGIVLSAQENLVAVYTDLVAAGGQSFPAIRILKQPLNRMTGEPAYDGMRVAAAATYCGNVKDSAWKNFEPEVINCVVPDADEIERVLRSISLEKWQALDGWLAHIPVANPGLYEMWKMNAAGATANAGPAEVFYAPGKPWFKTTPAIIGFSVTGAVVGLLIAVLSIWNIWLHRHRTAFPASHNTTMPAAPGQFSPARGASSPSPFDLKQTGPFAADTRVEANWGGSWIPGKITRVNPGGFSVMVQLEDRRFPHPIGLPTNQIRLK